MSSTFARRKAGLNATAYSYLVQALLTAPRSKAELEAISGVGPTLSSRLLKALRDRKAVYVAGWRLDAAGRMTIREFRIGVNTPDVPCPKLTRDEIVKRHYQKRKAERAIQQKAAQAVPAQASAQQFDRRGGEHPPGGQPQHVPA
jgi:predicted flap endonuclease-1-like 5' DNA nuclease